MPDKSQPETATEPRSLAALQEPFNLAAIMECKARAALEASGFKYPWKLAQNLAVAKSLDEESVYIKLGELREVGNIGNTKAFADFRGKLMEAFPDLTDCRT